MMPSPRILLALATLAAISLVLPAGADGNWQGASGGGAAAHSRSSQLGTGAQPTVAVNGRNVTVSWTAPSGGAPPSGYVVRRYDPSGNPQTVGSNCAAIVAATSCAEAAVPAGSWRYAVTPANANWRGTEGPMSAAAVVTGPALALEPTSVSTLPATLNGELSGFAGGQTVSFRLDNPATGTTLSGNISPSPVPAGGTATVSVTLPAGTSPGAHTVYAVGDAGDTAGAAVTVLAPQTVATTAWDLSDASGGGAEVNTSDPFAFAADGRTQATTAPSTAFATNRYLLVDFNSALPSNATPSSASFDFRFAAASALSTACFYFDVRRASTDAVLATHGSAASPSGCVTGTAQASFSVALPEVSTTAIANDLRVRVYLRDSASAAPVIDRTTISTTTSQGAFTLHDKVVTDRVNAGTTTRTWPLVASGGTTYTTLSPLTAAFASTRYLRLTVPAYVPSGATVTGASFTHRYRASGGGTVCWYFEVLQGATVIGAHGSPSSPISCNASTSAYVANNVSLPEINSPARANGAVVKIYLRNSSSERAQIDQATLTVNYSN